MESYKKAVILYVVIFSCSLLILITVSEVTSNGNISFLSAEYLILTIGIIIIMFAASMMKKIIKDLIPKEKR
jgi:hypothetical protein